MAVTNLFQCSSYAFWVLLFTACWEPFTVSLPEFSANLHCEQSIQGYFMAPKVFQPKCVPFPKIVFLWLLLLCIIESFSWFLDVSKHLYFLHFLLFGIQMSFGLEWKMDFTGDFTSYNPWTKNLVKKKWATWRVSNFKIVQYTIRIAISFNSINLNISLMSNTYSTYFWHQQ